MYQYYTIAIVALLGAISPGPDFVIIAKNALAHNRAKAILSSVGIGVGILVHTAYCVLGLTLVISQSILVFNTIKYLGAVYLIYLGIKALRSSGKASALEIKPAIKQISHWQAFLNGFLANLLNPKCTLFMLSFFTVIINPQTPTWMQASYGVEIALITAGWFIFLSLGLTHPVIKHRIQRVQHHINKASGVILVLLGIIVLFKHKSS